MINYFKRRKNEKRLNSTICKRVKFLNKTKPTTRGLVIENISAFKWMKEK